MHVILGLGNPGVEYALTRHNVGQWVIQRAAREWTVPLMSHPFGMVGAGRLGPFPVTLVLPATWMNLTGEIVWPLLNSLGQDSSHLFVVHDDLDLPVGRLRVKHGGGTGGHNGLRSIEAHLGTNAYGRVKIGIGRPEHGQDTADYVLSPFPVEEMRVVEEVVFRAVKALESVVLEGIEVAMARYNRRKPD